jgi:hypothetical protein
MSGIFPAYFLAEVCVCSPCSAFSASICFTMVSISVSFKNLNSSPRFKTAISRFFDEPDSTTYFTGENI